MSGNSSKTIVFAIAVVFAMAPLGLAQTSGSGTGATGVMEQSNKPVPRVTGTPATGMQDAIHATVADVDQQRHILKLRMQSGETVELKVPEQSLMNLQKGDSVQLSIRKAEAQSGMGATQPMQPGSSTSGAGTKSR